MALEVKEEYEPSLLSIILVAVFGTALGLILAAVNTAFLPIKTVKELPALEDRVPKTVYFIAGEEKGGSAWKSKSRAFMQQSPGTLIVTEGELNAWSRASFKPDPGKSDDGGILKFKMKATAPNFRIADGEMQISAKISVSLLGKSGDIVCQTKGTFLNMGGNYSFFADSGYLGSCPIPGIAELPNRIFTFFSTGFMESEASDSLRGPWIQLNDVLIDKNRLKLVR